MGRKELQRWIDSTKAIDEGNEGARRGYRQRWAKLQQWTKPLRVTDVGFRFCFWFLLPGQAREQGVRLVQLNQLTRPIDPKLDQFGSGTHSRRIAPGLKQALEWRFIETPHPEIL
ncbi:hypothetical protein C4D60_Mb05t00400 [Musa balbisiana]|uniref:Uncharacterized protein n=1 Tax=Musa balbisiana TaxID=52838 RepID=A0A4S8JSP1_MUSBA|nr:hypothetical protein C4D60_Mb05t00400 [Musa balbisiana]